MTQNPTWLQGTGHLSQLGTNLPRNFIQDRKLTQSSASVEQTLKPRLWGVSFVLEEGGSSLVPHSLTCLLILSFPTQHQELTKFWVGMNDYQTGHCLVILKRALARALVPKT